MNTRLVTPLVAGLAFTFAVATASAQVKQNAAEMKGDKVTTADPEAIDIDVETDGNVLMDEEMDPEERAEEIEDATERAAEAAEVLRELMTVKDKAIPEELMQRAKGIAVIPGVIKGAFVVGGQFGKGLVSTRLEDGTWSAPVFIDIGGASYGFQIGAEAKDLVLVFTEEKGLKALMNDKVKLGADISVAAGPLGRDASAGTNITFDSPIYSYSRSQGLFAGVSLDGTVLGFDDSANRAVYGMKGKSVLKNPKTEVPDIAQAFVVTLKEAKAVKNAEE